MDASSSRNCGRPGCSQRCEIGYLVLPQLKTLDALYDGKKPPCERIMCDGVEPSSGQQLRRTDEFVNLEKMSRKLELAGPRMANT